MILTVDNDKLPQWVHDNIMCYCTYCGAHIADNSDTGKLTARWCVNPYCPGHMMHKAYAIVNYYGAKGIGPETCLKYIKRGKYKTPFQIIPDVFGADVKPTASLAEIASLAGIDGYGMTQAQKELNSYATFELYFRICATPNPLLVENKELLMDAEKYFTLKPPRSVRKLYVMGTGSFEGYANREQFFASLNAVFGEYVDIIQTGKRKTGVTFLIKEKNAVDHSKSQIARQCGIPIITPNEFIAFLLNEFPYVSDRLK